MMLYKLHYRLFSAQKRCLRQKMLLYPSPVIPPSITYVQSRRTQLAQKGFFFNLATFALVPVREPFGSYYDDDNASGGVR